MPTVSTVLLPELTIAAVIVSFQEGYCRPRSPAETGNFDPNVWTGCRSQMNNRRISEVADMYPACLIGARAVVLMGIRTRRGLISGQVDEQPFGSTDFGRVS